MSTYTAFFLNGSMSNKQFELLEISHPNFSKTYYIVRNAPNGLTVTLETGGSQFFEFYPLKIIGVSSNDDLDQVLQVQLGDLGDIFPKEYDNVALASGFMTKPICKYRTYASNDLTVPLYGPLTLEITTFTSDANGTAFDASAPQVNASRTGEVYTIDRFPQMAGFAQ